MSGTNETKPNNLTIDIDTSRVQCPCCKVLRHRSQFPHVQTHLGEKMSSTCQFCKQHPKVVWLMGMNEAARISQNLVASPCDYCRTPGVFKR